jgi:hypothetical protein
MARKSVAVVGASSDRSKFGNKAVRAYRDQGWDVYPVNPRGGTIEGVTVYKALSDVPVKVDRVSLYLPPQAGMDVLPEIVEKKPAEFFVNPGADSDELVEKARELGLEPIVACSIVAIGTSPAAFPD